MTRRRGKTDLVSTTTTLALVLALAAPAAGQAVLGSGELRIVGLRFVIERDAVAQTVPRNQATGLRNRFVDPVNPSAVVDAELLAGVTGGLTLAGELSGPGIETPETVRAPAGLRPARLAHSKTGTGTGTDSGA